jgi:hypothetical protein
LLSGPLSDPSNDRIDGADDEVGDEGVQFPSPMDIIIDVIVPRYCGKTWSRVMMSTVSGMADPSIGREISDCTRVLVSSRIFVREFLAVSRIGWASSVIGFFMSGSLASSLRMSPDIISIISYAKKQSVIKFDWMWVLRSRSVFPKSLRADLEVERSTRPQSSRGNMFRMLSNSDASMPSSADVYGPMPHMPRLYSSLWFCFRAVDMLAAAEVARLLAM